MKKVKRVSVLNFFLFVFSSILMAQGNVSSTKSNQQNSWNITGTITDKKGEPLIGASVQIKGYEKKGAITNVDGVFSMVVSSNSVLVIKYLGYIDQEVKISNQKTLKIVLLEDDKLLSEVTVTALGIKREKKSLGYAVGEVKGDELNKAKEVNVMNALAGKIPGLIVSQTAGGPSGSSRVLIRGNTELSGNNEPLYVVDGIPLDNTNFGSAGTYGGYDLGDGTSSINPDDIESISVLKGPAASALYGSRASHGVILITTKRATKKNLGIEFNSTTTLERQLTKYDVQSTYGQGSNGNISGGSDDIYTSGSNWGPKLDEGLYINYFDGVQRPYKFIPDNINGFFRTGVTTTNTIVLNSVQNNTGVRLSYTNMLNQDIVPNTGMSRNMLNLRATSKFTERFDIDFKLNYVREDVKNRPALSGSGYNIGKNLMTLPNTFDQAWLRDSYMNEKGEYYDWNNNNVYNLNPYWVVNAMQNNSAKDRFSGSGVLKYKINNQFNVRLTGGGEINIMDFLNFAPFSTPGKTQGELDKRLYKNYTYNAELLFSYKNKIGLFDIGANAGGNLFFVNNRTNSVIATESIIRNSTALQSFRMKQTSESAYRKQINSLFGMVNLAYNDFLFLDATIRNDISSTLPAASRSYLYPSVSGSFLFSEILKWPALTYGKVRASAAQVGSDTSPFQLELTYNAPDKPYFNYPYAGNNRTRVPNKILKPTITNSIEFGLDLKFLKNRLGTEITYYSQNSRDQILFLPIANSTAYNEVLVNAGEIENKGIEVAVTTIPVQTKDFTWELNFNFANNENKVLKLAQGLDRFSLANAQWLNVTVDALVGENYGAIMSPYGFQKNENGDILVDAKGLPKVSDNSTYNILGSAMWDWTGGLSTSFKYKNFSLSAILDVKIGADLYSMTSRTLYSIGKSKATLEGRDGWYRSEEERYEAGASETTWTPTGGYLVNGVVETVDADGNKVYTPNTRYVNPQEYWSHVSKYDPSYFIFDNSYVKLREITFSYRFPKKMITKFADDITFSLVARNPFIIYKNIKDIDPDSNYNNGSAMGLEYGSLPSRRSYGFNLNVKF